MMARFRSRTSSGAACLLLLAGISLRLFAQNPGSSGGGESPPAPETLIGLTLEDLYARFGVPQAVHAVRGGEVWQDDVVLVYPQGDFYIFRDRVWQLGIPSARGIRVGDRRELVVLALGEGVREGEDCFILQLSNRPWPVSLRVNMDSGLVSGIFVYRSDF
ncbi:MAG: hypothetical protein LBQ46_07310 [Treponema sp.]|jgi:hypothetical protein|nr:hypothetical protein [Treponema sp.]